MTITSENKRNQYAITEAQVIFPYTFRILDQEHLLVIHTTAGGVETELELTTNYTVSGVGDIGGGNVTTCGDDSPYPTDDFITILRSVPLTQLTDYVEHDTFPAESHENALDKLTMIIQEISEKWDRMPILAKSSIYSNLFLPDPVASKYLAWKDDLSGLKNVELQSEGDLSVTDYIKTLLDDEDVAAAQTTLEMVEKIDEKAKEIKLDDFSTPDDNTDLNVSTVHHGLMPKLTDKIGRFYRSTGSYERLFEAIDVREYGAVGNGTTDDVTAIQAALDAADARGGAALFLSKGTYKITQMLTIGNDTRMFGEGRQLSTITGDLDTSLIQGKGGTTSRRYRIGFQHMGFDAVDKTAGSVGVDLRNLSECVAFDIWIRNCDQGLQFSNDAELGCFYNDVYSPEITDCNTAIILQANENHLFSPRINYVTTGISWGAATSCLIVTPCIENFATYGIVISTGAYRGSVIGGRFENIPTSGIGIKYNITCDTAKIAIINPYFVGVTTSVEGTGYTEEIKTVYYGGGSS